MSSSNPKLEWCIVRLGEDMNWWVEEISDPVRWDVDGLGILDPRQISHVLDLCDPLRDYGFDPDSIDSAFFRFRIDKELPGNRIRLIRTRETLSDSDDMLFALPDVVDEEKGPYADFLDQITKRRVRMLNDSIEFDQNLTIDELEDELRERQNVDFMEGRAVHFLTEISSILEYVPDGYELEDDDEKAPEDKDDLKEFDLPEDEESEKIEADETMKWDDDDDDENEDDLGEDDEDDEDEDEEEEKKPAPKKSASKKSAPKKSAPRKSGKK